MQIKYDAYEGSDAPGRGGGRGWRRGGWILIDVFPGHDLQPAHLCTADGQPPFRWGPNKLVIEFPRPRPEERYARAEDRADPGPQHDLGAVSAANLHEDLLGVHGQGIAMREKATDSKWGCCTGREENSTIHDEVGMRPLLRGMEQNGCNARPTIRWATTRSRPAA